MHSVVEALAALQERLDAGLPWEEKRFYVELQFKGVLVETKTDENGEHYPIAHVTYRLERLSAPGIPTPVEMEPLFSQVGENCTAPLSVSNSFPLPYLELEREAKLGQ